MNLSLLKMMPLLVLLFVSVSQGDMVRISVGERVVSISSKITNLKEFPIIVAIIGMNPVGEINGKLIKPDEYIPGTYRGGLYWVTKQYFDSKGISFITSNDVKQYFFNRNKGIADSAIESPIHGLGNNTNRLYGRTGDLGIPDSVPVDSLEYFYTIYKHGNSFDIYKSKEIWHMKNGAVKIEKFKLVAEKKDLNVKKAVRNKSKH